MLIGVIMTTKKLKGSITIEATFSFTITVFVLFLMLGPLLIIKTTSDFMIELNELSKTRCMYETIKYSAKESRVYQKVENWINQNETLSYDFENIEDTVNYALMLYRFTNKYDESHSEYNNIKSMYDMNMDTYDKDTGIVRFDYLVLFSLPYNVLQVEGVHKRIVSHRRAFIGASENRFGERREAEDVVYIANNFTNSGVYHTDINCTYLIKKTVHFNYSELSHHRNYNNKKFSKCSYCFDNLNIDEDTVCYVTQYGDRYHSYDLCPMMTAYVTQLSLDEISSYNIRPCSRCVKKEE